MKDTVTIIIENPQAADKDQPTREEVEELKQQVAHLYRMLEVITTQLEDLSKDKPFNK